MDRALDDDGLEELLAQTPDDDEGEYAPLELELGWPGLGDAHERLAARLRVFVITRDPLGWIAGRGGALGAERCRPLYSSTGRRPTPARVSRARAALPRSRR
ncbi:MAG: hypothetical protein MSC31_17055 [Solirubrobacteraceae bacterium MAG38_C4-C5]|nr:hypothetical protein [Candidatus Siliceabacter maunaloa]